LGSINGNTGSLANSRGLLNRMGDYVYILYIPISAVSSGQHSLTFSANSSRGRREIVGVALMSSLVGDGVIIAIISPLVGYRL